MSAPLPPARGSSSPSAKSAEGIDFRTALPAQGSLQLKGLHDDVTILRDRWGIPHVRAKSTADAFFAQGFVHAEDRMWHMEWDRRRAFGRSAELIGQPGLEADRLARRMQIERAARADWEILNAETRAMLEAYAAGVNAWLERTPVPSIEFETLGLRPDPWRPLDSLSVFKIRHVLMGLLHNKLWRLKVVLELGGARAAELYPDYRADMPLIIPPDTLYHGQGEHAVPLLEEASRLLPGSGGSNNWVLDGTRTRSGKPILAGDPHRAIDVPNVYYQNHLCSDEWDVVGVSFPGVPGFSHLGHNDRVAWAITHAGADYQDLYIERFDPNDATLYEHQGQWLQAEAHEERIAVKGSADVVETLRRTLHGPIIEDGPWQHHALAFKFIGFEPGKQFECFLPMMRARSVEELRESQREWVDPAQNLIMADVDGSIGYHTRGRVPVRSAASAMPSPAATAAEGIVLRIAAAPPRPDGVQRTGSPLPANGWLPVPGWSGAHEWTGYIPFEEMPRALNPDTHWIASANNRIVGDDYPHYLTSDPGMGYRYERIAELLRPMRDATADDSAALQADRLSVFAREFVPLLLALDTDTHGHPSPHQLAAGATGTGASIAGPSAVEASAVEASAVGATGSRPPDPTEPAGASAAGASPVGATGSRPPLPTEPVPHTDATLHEALAILRGWDYRLEPDSVPASIYAATRDALLRLLLEPIFGPELTHEMFSIGRGGSAHAARLRSHIPGYIRTNDMRLLDPSDPQRASWPAALRAALRHALRNLHALLGTDMRDWQWGCLHHTGPLHPLSVLPEVGPRFNPPTTPYGGDGDTVQAAGYFSALGFTVAGTQCYRQIIDLGDLAHARWVVPLGASGHPGSPHYADQLGPWSANQHIPMLYDWQEIEREAESKLELRPNL